MTEVDIGKGSGHDRGGHREGEGNDRGGHREGEG